MVLPQSAAELPHRGFDYLYARAHPLSMLRLRVRSNHRLPKILGVGGIVLYPYVLFADAVIDPVLARHELIHVRQVRQLGFSRFYLRYVAEYLTGRSRGLSHGEAYRNISFEREAYGEAETTRLTEAEISESGLNS